MKTIVWLFLSTESTVLTGNVEAVTDCGLQKKMKKEWVVWGGPGERMQMMLDGLRYRWKVGVVEVSASLTEVEVELPAKPYKRQDRDGQAWEQISTQVSKGNSSIQTQTTR
jgi:hypothetical protein